MSDKDSRPLNTLNTLIAATIDSANGFEDAAQRASDHRLKSIFGTFAHHRREMAQRLTDQVRRLGGAPEENGTLKAAAHRRWLDLKDALGRGDAAILNSVEAGETYIREKYDAALRDKMLSPGARKEIAEARASIASTKAQVQELRRRCGFAEATRDRSGDWGKAALIFGGLTAVAGIVAATSMRRGSQDREGEAEDFILELEADENIRLISSKKVEGTPVIGGDGGRLGKIDSFMVDKYSGRVAYAVMTFGGTMGFGTSLFPLPWSALTYDEDQGGYVIALTKDDLADAPRFEPSDEPEFDPAYRRQILIFYRSGDNGLPGGSGAGRSTGVETPSDSGSDGSAGGGFGARQTAQREPAAVNV